MSKNLVLRREEIVRNVSSLTPKHLKLDATVWAGGGGGEEGKRGGFYATND